MPQPIDSQPKSVAALSPTVENYLKHLFTEQVDQPATELLPMGKLASSMGVTPGTATSMVKTLADSGLVDYEPRGGVKLTKTGRQHALHVIRRHRLIELFLVKVLKLDWSEVHAEAEELEHAISDKVLEKIDDLLGHPQFDPHGDPIPGKLGQIAAVDYQTLAECDLHQTWRIARVTAQEADFLQTLRRLGLTPGALVVVETRDKYADSLTVRPDEGDPVNLGTAAAIKILVEPI